MFCYGGGGGGAPVTHGCHGKDASHKKSKCVFTIYICSLKIMGGLQTQLSQNYGGAGAPGAPPPPIPTPMVSLVGSIESFTPEPDLQLQARSDRIVLGVL